jgi:signal transduction histidine kinase
VSLEVGDRITLMVADDGDGFDATEEGTGFGIIGMRERAEAIDGVFTLTTAPGHGTAIKVETPWRSVS